jgi:hypothetical protein
MLWHNYRCVVVSHHSSDKTTPLVVRVAGRAARARTTHVPYSVMTCAPAVLRKGWSNMGTARCSAAQKLVQHSFILQGTGKYSPI